MTAYNKITEIVGNTPLLNIPTKENKLFVKLEKFNPSQSTKDRIAINMLNDAERKGILKKGGTVIETSSGNTATSLAMVCAERGYKFIAVVDCFASSEKILAIKAYGATVVMADKSKYKEGDSDSKERMEICEKLLKEIPGSIFLKQPENPANPEAYYNSLAPEIIKDTDGKINIYIASIGTGGSLCGTAKKLKEFNKNIEVYGVEPEGSVVFGGEYKRFYQSGSGSATVGGPKNFNKELVDVECRINDKEAFNTCRFLAKHGILLGGSGGSVVYQAYKILKNTDRKDIVAVCQIVDGGEKYLENIYNDDWMNERGLIDLSIQKELEEFFNF